MYNPYEDLANEMYKKNNEIQKLLQQVRYLDMGAIPLGKDPVKERVKLVNRIKKLQKEVDELYAQSQASYD